MYASQRRGASCEYMAAAVFSDLGWTVFWTPTGSSPCDFIINRGKETKRVQVKSASWMEQAGTRYLRAFIRPRRRYTRDDFDLLVAVAHDGRVWSIPFRSLPKTATLYLEREKGGTLHRYGRGRWLIKT